MRLLINGVETELHSTPGVQVHWSGDRWIVSTSQGTVTGLAIKRDGKTFVSLNGQVFELEKPGQQSRSRTAAGSRDRFTAPMPGQITEVFVELNQKVVKGQRLLVLEAMKTQQPMSAPFDGTVVEVPVTKGQQVPEGALLVRLEPDDQG